MPDPRRPPREVAGVAAAPLPEPIVELFREAAVAVLPTTPPGAGVERGAVAVRGVLPERDPLDELFSLDTERLGRDGELDGVDEDGPDRDDEPLSAPPDPADDPPEPPELDPPDEPPDELEPAVVRGTACAERPAGAASASPRAIVSANRVERVIALTPQAAKAAYH
jgi:hypothetical protein